MSRKYSNEDVVNALNEVVHGATIAASARKFGIPRSTLSEKRSGKHPIECRMGPDTVLTNDEENLLVEWIFHVSDAGFPVTKRQLLDSVQTILNKSKRKTVFTNNRPGRKWYAAFRKRHPKVVERESQNLTRARASVTEEDLRKWFAEVYETLEKTNQLDILDDPSRIFNMDETGFYLSPKPGKVLARKGDRRVYSKIDNDDKECITTLIGGNASGLMTPPLVMFPYQRLPSNILKRMPETWAFGRSTNGWMTSESFYEYITNCFHPWLVANKIKFPILLFVDGHASHVTYHLTDYCSKNGIVLIALFPNATHVIQPMDVSGFRPMKCSWLKAVLNWRMDKNGARFTREHFAPLLKKVLDLDMREETITNGFEKCGLYPFTADAIDYGQLIKKRKLMDKNDQQVPQEVPNYFLKQFEEQMEPIKLDAFKKSGSEWQGEKDDIALFNYWRKIGGCISPDDGTNNFQLYGANDIIFEYIDATDGEFNLETGAEICNLDQNAITVATDDEKTDGDNTDDELSNTEQSEDEQIDADRTDEDRDFISTVQPNGCDILSVPVQESIVYSSENVNDFDAGGEGTSMREINSTVIDTNSSTYFKDLLFWPGRNATCTKSGLKQNKKKDKIPAVLTSAEAMTYLKAKEAERERLEQEKIERKKQRALKKDENLKEVERKTKLKEERKTLMTIKKMELENGKKKKEAIKEENKRLAIKKAEQQKAKKIRGRAIRKNVHKYQALAKA